MIVLLICIPIFGFQNSDSKNLPEEGRFRRLGYYLKASPLGQEERRIEAVKLDQVVRVFVRSIFSLYREKGSRQVIDLPAQ